MSEKLFSLFLLFALCLSIYNLWFIGLPGIVNDFWRGIATFGASLLMLLLLPFGWVVVWFGLLGKD